MLDISDEWAQNLEEAPADNLRRIGCANMGSFISGGTLIAKTMVPVVQEHARGIEAPQVLDFGCGIGRVALPMHHYLKLPTHCSDIDQSAVAWLGTRITDAHCTINTFDPPLPFADESMDVVYSVSIWTHLSKEMERPWLEEVRRVLKPGGTALITTSSYAALKTRKRKGIPAWMEVTDEQLDEEGIIYTESKYLESKKENFPGVTSSYGMTAHSPLWVRDQWSKVMEVRETRLAVIAGTQDLNILKKT
ncbi:MAG: class I SAM-dependent methyltransferase [Pseudomonadota bacterium]